MKTIEKIMEACRKGSLAVSAIALIALALLEIIEIFLRTFFKTSLLIVDEYAGYLLATMVFMGLCNSFHGGGFVRVEALYNLFRGIPKRVLDILFMLVMDVLFYVITYECVYLNIQNFQKKLVSSTVVKTPIWIPQILMSIGLVMFCVYITLHTIQLLAEVFKKEGDQK